MLRIAVLAVSIRAVLEPLVVVSMVAIFVGFVVMALKTPD
jgi:hypothetical protein